MIKCIIVEDEFPAREELKYFINSNGSFEIQNEFENPIDALKYIESNDVEVVFLDINMPELDGMTLGKIINRFNKEIKLIFMSAYKDYAVEAFEIKAFDYILKPYSEERINNVLNNLTEEFSKNSSTIKESNITKITVNLDSKMFVLSTNDILYIEADEKETHIFTENGMYSSKMKISQLENILTDNLFFRCHRSYIVNIDKIVEVEPW
ncbi:MAG: LytR/AlgR family response regulator transcription factor, partial [Cetobacterium sp.]